MNKWYEDAIMYHFFTFGACNAPFYNDKSAPISRIKEIEKWIPHLKEMNINVVLFSPLFESISHGYDTSDYYKLDSRLGTNEDLKELVHLLHENGIKVVLDGVFNHCGRNFFAFKDVLEHKESSQYCSWFSNLKFGEYNEKGDPFTYESWAGYLDLPKYNLNDNNMKDYLYKAVGYWIDYFNIDGLRLDAAEDLNHTFMKELREFTTWKKNNFWLMGEIVNGDYRNYCSNEKLHSATNYELFKGIYSSHNEQNLFEIAYSLKRQFDKNDGIYNYFLPCNFVDNHDQNRLASLVDKPQYLYTIYILLFTMVGMPSIYYGSEFAIEGIKGIDLDKHIRPFLDINDLKSKEKALYNVIKKLTEIRKNSLALKKGTYEEISIEYHKSFIFKREFYNETVYVIINPNDNEDNIYINDDRTFYDALNEEYINDKNNININKYWGRILISK